jgi:hypothetical protein
MSVYICVGCLNCALPIVQALMQVTDHGKMAVMMLINPQFREHFAVLNEPENEIEIAIS